MGGFYYCLWNFYDFMIFFIDLLIFLRNFTSLARIFFLANYIEDGTDGIFGIFFKAVKKAVTGMCFILKFFHFARHLIFQTKSVLL